MARAGFVVGISATMLIAPQIVRRYRARRVAPVAAGLCLVSIGLAGASFGTISFAALMCAAGALSALIDIGQNVIAVRLEKVRMQCNPRARSHGNAVGIERTDEAEVRDLVTRAADALVGLDPLIANAGVGPSGTLAELSPDVLDHIFAVSRSRHQR